MTLGDKIVIIITIIIALLGMLTINFFIYNDSAKGVLIEVNGEEYAKYNFNDISSIEYIEIKTQYGYNKVEINNKKVRVIEASCPDKLDVKAGWISKTNQMLVCLPNKVLIRIIGKNNEVDGVVY